MIIPLIAGSLFCSTPVVEIKTDVFTEKDQQTLVYVSKEGCAKQNPMKPCVKFFRVVEEGIYSVICGAQERRRLD